MGRERGRWAQKPREVEYYPQQRLLLGDLQICLLVSRHLTKLRHYQRSGNILIKTKLIFKTILIDLTVWCLYSSLAKIKPEPGGSCSSLRKDTGPHGAGFL